MKNVEMYDALWQLTDEDLVDVMEVIDKIQKARENQKINNLTERLHAIIEEAQDEGIHLVFTDECGMVLDITDTLVVLEGY